MREHGVGPDPDFLSDVLVNKVELIIRELRGILKDSIPEGEMEMFLNSIVSTTLLVTLDEINRPILSFCDAIVDANLPEKYGPMKVRVLTNLIYVVPEGSNVDKYRIFVNLVKQWIKEWKISTEQVQDLYRFMYEAYVQAKDTDNALKLLLELLGTYTKENASKARPDAIKCIISSIGDPNVFIMDHLLLLEPVKYLEGETIHNLLTIFVSGKLQNYLDFYSNQRNFIESSGLNHENNVEKMRLLTFLQTAENQKELTFDMIQNEMQIEQDEVESFVIEAVRTKMIRCKIDHLSRKVLVDCTAQRTFTRQHWQVLKERLELWRVNLTTINKNLGNLMATKAMST
ncbi:unnamed protein product [Didymodactylos carnosus]|nr:unnamed protein product [Didymodactylos carnosus]CAF4134933.1 unnamed protein product [Didymodactylos carnosus]